MTRLRALAITSAAAIAALLSTSRSHAIPLPDNSSCSSTTACLRITNSNADGIRGTGGTGVRGIGGGTGVLGEGSVQGVLGMSNNVGVWGDSAPGYGVLGSSTATGIGVYGESQSGAGVWGSSANYDGVHAVTGNVNAAAVAAISPSNSGRAYWGTGYIQITGAAFKPGGGSWSASSDARVKKDVKVLEWSIDQLKRVHPVKFKYNGLGETDDDGREFVGVIAQDLEKVLPEMITTKKAKFRRTDKQETDIKMVDPSAFTYILINAVKEQQEYIEQQERRIAALERPRGSLSASFLGGGLGMGLTVGLLPLALGALRRRREKQQALAV